MTERETAGAGSHRTGPTPKGLKQAKGTYGKTAKVGALWSIGRQVVSQLLTIPTALLLARLLSPSDFGIAAGATFFIAFARKLGGFGLAAGLIRMPHVREDHLSSVFVVSLAYNVVSWAALMAAAPWIGAFYADARVSSAVRVASTVFLFNAFGTVEAALIARDMRFKQTAIIGWTIDVVMLAVSVTMAWLGWGYWAIVWGQLASSLAEVGLKVYFGRWRPSFRVTRLALSETVPFGMGVYAKRGLTFAAENLDSFTVGGLFGVTSLGFYDKAYNAANKVLDRLSMGPGVVFRIFAIIQEDRPRFVRAYTKVVLTATFVTLPVFAGLIVAGREFIVVVFGAKWLPAVAPFQWLCAAGGLRVLTAYASTAIQASGRIWGEVWRNVTLVLLIVSLILVLRPWGITGAAFGVFAATCIVALLMQGLVRQITGLTWRELLRPMWPGALAACGTALSIGATTFAAPRLAPGLPDWALLLMQAATGAACWLAFAFSGRFAALQEVVDEVIDEMLPVAVRRRVDRFRRRTGREPAARPDRS